MKEYTAKVNTSVFPLGIITKGEKLRRDHLDALGPATIVDMVERGVLVVTGDDPNTEENMTEAMDTDETSADQTGEHVDTMNADEAPDATDKREDEDDSDEDDTEDQFDDEAVPPEIDIMDGVVQGEAEPKDAPGKKTAAKKPAAKKTTGGRKAK